MTRKSYREWSPLQSFLLPPSPSDWLPEDDLAYFILEVVEQLDLSQIEDAIQSKDSRGNRPHDPRMMTALLVYGYCVGVRSSRKIERATYRDVAFRVIAGGTHPDHTCISEFRRQHLTALEVVFLTTVRMAQELGLAKLGRVALDGTKVKANASKHKAMSYERMLKAEAELKAEIEQMLQEAERVDQQEDERFGRGRRGDELPEELRRRKDRLAKIAQVKAELEAGAARARAAKLTERAEKQRQKAKVEPDPVERKRAATRAAKSQKQADELNKRTGNDDDPPDPPDDLPHHRVPSTPEGKPKAKAQRNFTDPDSRIMKRDGAFMQGYNCQAAVDEEHQIIVAEAVTNQAPDQEHLPPVVERIRENCGVYPRELLGDAGYWDQQYVSFCEERGIEPYISPGRLKHGETLPPIRGRPPKNLDAKGWMLRKLRTKKGRQIYSRRKVIVEPVFGQVRVAQAVQHFLLRGRDKVRGEWSLICGAHNLLKIFRARHAAV
jgi:transposase